MPLSLWFVLRRCLLAHDSIKRTQNLSKHKMLLQNLLEYHNILYICWNFHHCVIARPEGSWQSVIPHLPFDEGGGFAVRRSRRERINPQFFSPPVFLLRKNPAPSSEGAKLGERIPLENKNGSFDSAMLRFIVGRGL